MHEIVHAIIYSIHSVSGGDMYVAADDHKTVQFGVKIAKSIPGASRYLFLMPVHLCIYRSHHQFPRSGETFCKYLLGSHTESLLFWWPRLSVCRLSSVCLSRVRSRKLGLP